MNTVPGAHCPASQALAKKGLLCTKAFCMAGLRVLCKWTLGQVIPAHSMARPRAGCSQDLLELNSLHSVPKIPNRDTDANSSPIIKSPHGTEHHNSGENSGGTLFPSYRDFNYALRTTVPGGTMDCGVGMGGAAQGCPTITRSASLCRLPMMVGIWRSQQDLCSPTAQGMARPDLLGYWCRDGVTRMWGFFCGLCP